MSREREANEEENGEEEKQKFIRRRKRGMRRKRIYSIAASIYKDTYKQMVKACEQQRGFVKLLPRVKP